MDSEKDSKDEKPDFQKFLLEGDTYKTLLTKKWLSRKPFELKDPNKISSFIPGTILKVFVKEGQKVKKGDHLLILEAMKMNNVILAPMNCTIAKLHVYSGIRVANNQLLVEIEPEKIIEKEKSKKVNNKKKKRR